MLSLLLSLHKLDANNSKSAIESAIKVECVLCYAQSWAPALRCFEFRICGCTIVLRAKAQNVDVVRGMHTSAFHISANRFGFIN
mmetsp:Transcript_46383/g.55826  ORF Transcript_46383/g.55826 Transcript_46383/m.55826 type:complete len:84 (-) Transcript_46383:1291-1542(-)